MQLILATTYNFEQDTMLPAGRIHVLRCGEMYPWGKTSLCGEIFGENRTRSYTTDKTEIARYTKAGGHVCKRCLNPAKKETIHNR